MKDWRELERLYHLALQKSGGEREAFFLELTLRDPILLDKVKALLANREEGERLFQTPALEQESEHLDVMKEERSASPNPSLENSHSDAPRPGQTFRQFRIEEKIGQGGMGQVFLAHDTILDRQVALKFLPGWLLEDRTAHKRFVREAKSAASLDHPFVCSIHEISQTDEGDDFIVMEYVQGQTLKRRLREGPVPLEEALKIASEVAEALEKAHGSGIVHRDLKPANIILTPEGHAKVMDFGLAKRVRLSEFRGEDEQSLTDITQEGSTVGTVAYMSPEQTRSGAVDTRSDIFSFGVVLFEMLAGRHPFKKSFGIETVNAIRNETPPALPADTPGPLQNTVKKMLAKDPADRYQSVHEVRTNLNHLSDGVSRPSEDDLPKRKPLWITGLVALILAVLIAYWGWDVLRQSDSVLDQDRKSIAVLPFENLSGSPETEYFSDGIAEDITLELSKIGDLMVVARTSAFRYKGSDKSLREIGQELGVTALLEGSVRRLSGRVRITVQLIDVQTEAYIWADTYDEAEAEVFDIQSRVARQIASELVTVQSQEEPEQIARKPTDNLEAYNLYLQGRSFHRERTEETLRKSVELFRRATTLDPDFAPAYVAEGQSFLKLGVPLGNLPATETLPRVRQLAERALSIDENLAEAYTLLAICAEGIWDWEASERNYRQAIHLNPNSAYSHGNFAWYLSATGRQNEAIAEAEMSARLGPVDPISWSDLGSHYRKAGRHEEALRCFERALDLDPDFQPAILNMGITLVRTRQFEMGLEYLRKSVWYSGRKAPILAFLGIGYAQAGQTDKATEILEELLHLVQTQTELAPYIAMLDATLGNRDAAFKWLEEAFQSRHLFLPFVITTAECDPLRSDPRYHDLVRRMNLPE